MAVSTNATIRGDEDAKDSLEPTRFSMNLEQLWKVVLDEVCLETLSISSYMPQTSKCWVPDSIFAMSPRAMMAIRQGLRYFELDA
jgi:hypothetical protein